MARTMKKSTKATSTPKQSPKYKPTEVGLGVDAKGKPHVLVGARRIAGFKGDILDRATRYWSQLKYVRVGKDGEGRPRLTTARAAATAGLELVG